MKQKITDTTYNIFAHLQINPLKSQPHTVEIVLMPKPSTDDVLIFSVLSGKYHLHVIDSHTSQKQLDTRAIESWWDGGVLVLLLHQYHNAI